MKKKVYFWKSSVYILINWDYYFWKDFKYASYIKILLIIIELRNQMNFFFIIITNISFLLLS